MNISALSDDELNRAMIWINPPSTGIFNDCCNSGIWADTKYGYAEHWDYLAGWSLTGPMMIEQSIDIDKSFTDGCHDANSQHGHRSTNINPLRAICECRLMIYLESKK